MSIASTRGLVKAVILISIELVTTIYQSAAQWLNANQGVLGALLFVLTILAGWASGIFAALRRRPRFRLALIPGPTFVCTFGVKKEANGHQVHRTGFAIYLEVSNVGSAPSSVQAINIGYHWALRPFSRQWLRYRVGWFWLQHQSVCLTDFQVAIGDNLKFFPFLTQRSHMSGESADTFLEVGKATNGVVYFEQVDSWGGCFPVSVNGEVTIRLAVSDVFGRKHTKTFSIPKVTLAEAKKFNPTFGETLSTLGDEELPFELPVDNHGNLFPPNIT